MGLTMLKSEGFENVWVELKGSVGTRHESENSNNREDIDVENFTYRRLREERVVACKSCCILASKLAFHQIRSSARSKRIFDADSTPIKAKRFRHDRFPLHHDQVLLDFLNECCVRHTVVKWAITFDSLPYPVCLKISAIEYVMPVPDRLELITFTFINNEKETDKLLNQNHSFLLFPPLVLHCLVLLRITCAMRHKHLVLEDVLYDTGNQYLMDMMLLISLNSSKTYTCSNFAMHILYRIIIKIVSTYSFNEPERKRSEFIFCICSNFYPFTVFRINNWRPNCNNLRLYNHFKHYHTIITMYCK
ncbi:unnamed protein product [Rhizophagus irregularis]|nr:unnamed protein product [Rhizophagus irregularis]